MSVKLICTGCQQPFETCQCSKWNTTGITTSGSSSWPHQDFLSGSAYMPISPSDLENIRQMVAEEVRKALHQNKSEEYTDAQTGMRMTVEHDVPHAPLVMLSWAEEGTAGELKKINEAIGRLLRMAGLEQEPVPIATLREHGEQAS